MSQGVRFNNGKVERRYTEEWAQQGVVRIEALPRLLASLVSERAEMLVYIRELQDKLDYVLEHNRCCDISGCLTAGCTSDHQ